MKIRFLLFFILLLSINSFSQNERVMLFGNIKSEGDELENIHVLNKNSKIGTITNAKGFFSIEVREKDTLIVTGIQFYYSEILITKQHIKDLTITINLLQKTNKLDEVIVKHNLTGSIFIDANNIKTTKNVEDGVLNFSEIDMSSVGNINDDFSRSRTSNDSQLMPNMNPNLIAIAGLLLKPLTKIGETKRNIKKRERYYQNKVLDAPKSIRIDFGDSFFTETLQIPTNQIDEFITYCLPKGIANLYVDNQKIKIIDIFLQESKTYLKGLKNED